MTYRKKIAAIAVTVSFLSACAGLTPTREVTEGYRVYDVRGTQNHSEIVANLKSTMQKNADKVRFTNDIPPYPLPEKAGRFTLTNPFGKSGMGALLAAQGHSVKIPQCADSVFSATSNDSFRGAENTTFFVCLIPYTEGYHMDVYYTYTKVSGGFSPEALGRSLAQQMVGDSSQFIPRIIAALETSVQTSGAEIKLLDSYPQ